MIEEWLLVKDEYSPADGNNRFIDKSIFSFLKIISTIRQSRNKDKLIYKINPTVKVISTILNILLISITRSFTYLLIMDICILIYIFLLDKEDRKKIIEVSFIFPLITLIALLPAMFQGNLNNSMLLFQKIISSILLANILSYSTKWNNISRSLKVLFVPDLFIWIIDITIKYIILLGEYSMNLLYSFKLRSIGKSYDEYGSISRIMGNLFLKSYKISEEVSYAMECRGFVGEYSMPLKLELKKVDYIYTLLNIFLFGLFVFQILNY